MHQNAPLPAKKNFWGAFSPDPSPLGYPLPGSHPLDYRAFGAQRSRSFSFTTRTLLTNDILISLIGQCVATLGTRL